MIILGALYSKDAEYNKNATQIIDELMDGLSIDDDLVFGIAEIIVKKVTNNDGRSKLDALLLRNNAEKSKNRFEKVLQKKYPSEFN